ncbi:aminoacyl-tRNA hydrolase [Campylobacter hepaticus]|uniref:Peptidyl-tRNA hydrolase n=1 Tax=Campylobacter hepaticus TaxID=1813019 RepID=A0A424Z362_9BACT|nr:aminoacyl-tRNA hydrolase [Campylobacter hepaticus]RQD68765.1 aminoacyl-tRNA hydrolase [Campylobacter hepaticus]RQD88720.1 aminoacyl-tRNA hydrolase [Campylobacter hepaticus]
MILVVGLGNIGVEYENTRHNAGFMLINLLLKESNFINLTHSQFKGELFKLSSSLLLLKPSTYMNNSGISVKIVSDFYKCERIIVIHDDIDLHLGVLRFKKGGSSGGHNGLKSIDSLCGNDYERIRIGIGKGEHVLSHVLGNFKAEEELILSKVLIHAKEALFELIKNDNLSLISSKYSLNV